MCVSRTFSPFRVVFFYLVTTGWIFDMSCLLCEISINRSINQPINQSTNQPNVLSGGGRRFLFLCSLCSRPQASEIAHRVNIYVDFRVGDQYAAFEKQKQRVTPCDTFCIVRAHCATTTVILLRAFSELLICMLHQFGLGCIKNGAL